MEVSINPNKVTLAGMEPTDDVAVYIFVLYTAQRSEGALFEDGVHWRRISKDGVVGGGLDGLCGGHDVVRYMRQKRVDMGNIKMEIKEDRYSAETSEKCSRTRSEMRETEAG